MEQARKYAEPLPYEEGHGLTRRQSTLNQIRTQGINRGGLYGFFVKGEAIAGTIDDSSVSATDASIPPSGASTPPTSASESEAPATKPAKMADKKNKRKRQDDEAPKEVKKAKKASTKPIKADAPVQKTPSSKDEAAVAKKIAKLSPKKKEGYEQRAAAKKQTLHDYILRRIQKKSAKHARYPESESQPAFFTDLEGDASIPQQVAIAAPTLPVLGLVDATSAQAVVPALEISPTNHAKSTVPDDGEAPQEDEFLPLPKITADDAPKLSPSEQKAQKKAAIKAKRRAKEIARKASPGLALMREKRQAKKEAKKAIKAEKALKLTNSKWGVNKDKSRWAKIKQKKLAEKAAAAAAKSCEQRDCSRDNRAKYSNQDTAM